MVFSATVKLQQDRRAILNTLGSLSPALQPPALPNNVTPASPPCQYKTEALPANVLVCSAICCATSHAPCGCVSIRADNHSGCQTSSEHGNLPCAFSPRVRPLINGIHETWVQWSGHSSAHSCPRQKSSSCSSCCRIVQFVHALRSFKRRIMARSRSQFWKWHVISFSEQAHNWDCERTLRCRPATNARASESRAARLPCAGQRCTGCILVVWGRYCCYGAGAGRDWSWDHGGLVAPSSQNQRGQRCKRPRRISWVRTDCNKHDRGGKMRLPCSSCLRQRICLSSRRLGRPTPAPCAQVHR